MKKLASLKGVKALGKEMQKKVLGGDDHNCFCLVKLLVVPTPCSGTCPDGTQPFCP